MNSEFEYTAYEIEGQDYIVAKTIKYKNDNYCCLINISDPKDTFIKKYENGQLLPLTSAEDLVNILLLIANKGA